MKAMPKGMPPKNMPHQGMPEKGMKKEMRPGMEPKMKGSMMKDGHMKCSMGDVR